MSLVNVRCRLRRMFLSLQGVSPPAPPLDALDELQRLAADRNPVQTLVLLKQRVLCSLAGVIGFGAHVRGTPFHHDRVGDGRQVGDALRAEESFEDESLLTAVETVVRDTFVGIWGLVVRWRDALSSAKMEKERNWNEARWGQTQAIEIPTHSTKGRLCRTGSQVILFS